MTFFSVGLESRLQIALYERKMSLTKGDGDGTPSSLDGNGYGCCSGLGAGDGYKCDDAGFMGLISLIRSAQTDEDRADEAHSREMDPQLWMTH